MSRQESAKLAENFFFFFLPSSGAFCRIGCLNRAKCQVLLSQLRRALTRKRLSPSRSRTMTGISICIFFPPPFLPFHEVKVAHCCNPTVICSLAFSVHLCVELLFFFCGCASVRACACVCAQ